MPTPIEEIVERYHERKNAAGPLLGRMTELRDAVNGDIVIPLPELDQDERPAVANLIAQGLDQTAQRIASTMPNVSTPPTRPGIQASENKARRRRSAILGWWAMNDLHLHQRLRARYLIGYGCAPAVIRPIGRRHGRTHRLPFWDIRNPLTTFPPPGADMEPTDCIFTFRRTLRWLRSNYPLEANHLLAGTQTPGGRRPNPDDVYEILEYVDGEELVLIALAKAAPPSGSPDYFSRNGTSRAAFAQLGERVPNRTGICPAVVPGRITLDRRAGQFDSLIGIYLNQAKLMALETIAVERSIFPDEWLISRPNEVATIVSEADGLRGELGHITGGDLQTRPIQPGVQTYPTIDRLERAMRLTGGIPAEFGGESVSNVRTGRRGQQILSATIDFSIQEAQELLASSLQKENIRAIAFARTHYGNEPRSFYFSWQGRRGHADYTPSADFETDENTVAYSFPGSDLNDLVIGTGQRIGMGTMSKRRGMELDPLVDDPELEHDRIIAEGLEQATLASLQTLVSQGGMAPLDVARISQLVVAENTPLYEAIMRAQEEAQARQATSGPPGSPEGPVDPTAPEAQPGLTEAPTAAAGAAIPNAGPPSLGNLANLLSNLRRPAMTIAAER